MYTARTSHGDPEGTPTLSSLYRTHLRAPVFSCDLSGRGRISAAWPSPSTQRIQATYRPKSLSTSFQGLLEVCDTTAVSGMWRARISVIVQAPAVHPPKSTSSFPQITYCRSRRPTLFPGPQPYAESWPKTSEHGLNGLGYILFGVQEQPGRSSSRVLSFKAQDLSLATGSVSSTTGR